MALYVYALKENIRTILVGNGKVESSLKRDVEALVQRALCIYHPTIIHSPEPYEFEVIITPAGTVHIIDVTMLPLTAGRSVNIRDRSLRARLDMLQIIFRDTLFFDKVRVLDLSSIDKAYDYAEMVHPPKRHKPNSSITIDTIPMLLANQQKFQLQMRDLNSDSYHQGVHDIPSERTFTFAKVARATIKGDQFVEVLAAREDKTAIGCGGDDDRDNGKISVIPFGVCAFQAPKIEMSMVNSTNLLSYRVETNWEQCKNINIVSWYDRPMLVSVPVNEVIVLSNRIRNWTPIKNVVNLRIDSPECLKTIDTVPRFSNLGSRLNSFSIKELLAAIELNVSLDLLMAPSNVPLQELLTAIWNVKPLYTKCG